MHRSDQDPRISETEEAAIVEGIIKLARAARLTTRATARRRVPTELAFSLIAVYVVSKDSHGLQESDLTSADLPFFAPLPTRTDNQTFRTIRYLERLIRDQVGRRHLLIRAARGQPKTKRGQAANYEIYVGTI